MSDFISGYGQLQSSLEALRVKEKGHGKGKQKASGYPLDPTSITTELPRVLQEAHDMTGSLPHPDLEDTCSICLEEFIGDSICVKLACGHTFHQSCISETIDSRCPNCRERGVIKRRYRFAHSVVPEPVSTLQAQRLAKGTRNSSKCFRCS